MKGVKDGFFKRLGVSEDGIKREYGIDLYLFLDAVALGLKDEEISDVIGYDLDKVKKVRQRLGNVGSEIGLAYKKDLLP
ncbi:MAG: hypothetical protein NUV45_10470 [Tepidanaerobacteraceae bacterium]|jgi:hypothetical protein|nr:hypothetical protein [Tepidanaerobacteraceae bacterium]